MWADTNTSRSWQYGVRLDEPDVDFIKDKMAEDENYSPAVLNRANAQLKLDHLEDSKNNYIRYLELEPETPQREKIETIIALLEAEIIRRANEKPELINPDSFVENEGNMINMYERAELRLYFASEDGQKLVEKVETVTYNGNISMDRLVVDNIISGPKGTDAFSTINPSTVVNSVTTQDGICYVNLSEDFLNKITNVTDEVMIYSIVNSLTELGNINKVQILIDGEMNIRLGEYDLSTPFERDLDMIR